MQKNKKRVVTLVLISINVCLWLSCSSNTATSKESSLESSIIDKTSENVFWNTKAYDTAITHSTLDIIYVEKLLDQTNGKKRVDNFHSLLKIKTNDLQYHSKLYNVKQLNDAHFVISQKKDYSDARNFNLLVQTNDSAIIKYFVVNDFMISDIKQDGTAWIILLSDFYQSNRHWRSEQQIQIVKLDSEFEELWRYAKNIDLPLSEKSLSINKDNYTFNIEVITGCHICYSLAELVLSKDGGFVSLKSIGGEADEQLTDDELIQIFN